MDTNVIRTAVTAAALMAEKEYKVDAQLIDAIVAEHPQYTWNDTADWYDEAICSGLLVFDNGYRPWWRGTYTDPFMK